MVFNSPFLICLSILFPLPSTAEQQNWWKIRNNLVRTSLKKIISNNASKKPQLEITWM